MTDTEREFWVWAAFILLVFMVGCALVDLADQGRPIPSPVVEDGPPPSMVTQLLEEAKEITRRAAERADTDDAG